MNKVISKFIGEKVEVRFFIVKSIFSIIGIIFSTVVFCSKFKIYEENDPNIYLTGVKSFLFSKKQTHNPEYNPGISNLGYTGKPLFDCYEGLCAYKTSYTCTETVCEEDEENNIRNCYYVEKTCYETAYFAEYSSSSDCRNSNGKSCYSCSGHASSCHCLRKKDDEDFRGHRSCTADNIIFNWKSFYYNRENATNGIPVIYSVNNENFGKLFIEHAPSYLDSAVPPNETCPNNKHQCGILDELGNKLCYPLGVDCPINHITLNKPEQMHGYNNYTIDGVTIYYTNQAINYGKVLGGFFVDSDLKINYNIGDCEIISTSSISELLNSQGNKLYKESLNFNPYIDKNIDKKGKAYLKWCIPGVGKEKNITLIKSLSIEYNLNVTSNKFMMENRDVSIISYVFKLYGYIIILIPMKLISLPFLKIIIIIRNNKTSSTPINLRRCIPNCIVIFLTFELMFLYGISPIVIIMGLIYSMANIEHFDNTFKLYEILTYIESPIIFLLVIIQICYMIYFGKYKRKKGFIELEKKNENTTELKSSKENNNNLDFNTYDNLKDYAKPLNTNETPLTPDVD